jgi:hypothetical protein
MIEHDDNDNDEQEEGGWRERRMHIVCMYGRADVPHQARQYDGW